MSTILTSHGSVHSGDDLLSSKLELEGFVSGEAAVDESSVLQMESVLLVDKVSWSGLLAVFGVDLMGDFDFKSIVFLPGFPGDSSEEIDELNSVVEGLVRLDVVSFTSTFSKS